MNNLVVLLAIQTLVSILLIVWVRLRVMRSLDDGESIARVRREIGAMIVELDGSADRNITVIEDRLHELKVCIAEADKRIVMLSNESARASGQLCKRLSHCRNHLNRQDKGPCHHYQTASKLCRQPSQLFRPASQLFRQPGQLFRQPGQRYLRFQPKLHLFHSSVFLKSLLFLMIHFQNVSHDCTSGDFQVTSLLRN